jgi:hypothetical protein
MVGLVTLLVLAASAPAAWAGTYDVVSCGAPGAGGVNKAWVSALGDLRGFNPDAPEANPNDFDFGIECAGGLFARSHFGPPHEAAGFGTSATLSFTAAPGTAIVGAQLTRYGEARPSADNPDTPENESGRWEVFAQDGKDGTQIGGPLSADACKPQGGNVCTIGSSGGTPSPRYRLAGSPRISWGVVCGGDSGPFSCFTNAGEGFGYYPLATFLLYAATVTVEDLERPGAVAAGGPITAEGWRSWTDGLEVSARDASGIRAVSLAVNGRTLSESQEPCDFRDPRPCRDLATSPRDLTSGRRLVGDGTHTLAVTVTDPAGNAATIERPLKIDENSPQLSVRRPAGRTIVVDATDQGSGLASAQIEARFLPDGIYAPVTTRIEPGKIVGKVASGSASKLGLRVTARDAAGHSTVVEGLPSVLSVTSAVVGGRSRPVRNGLVRTGARKEVTFRGRLRSGTGQPLGSQTLRVTSTLRRTGAGTETVGTATTGADGKFSVVVPAGPSRVVQLSFDGAVGALPAGRKIQLRVPASSTINASPRRVGPGGRVRFSGRLRTAGQPVPEGGKLVDLQAFDRGQWRTFDTTRARGKKARWRASYRFGGRPGRYPIRLRIRREGAFPFELGYSTPVVVRVG